MINFKHKPYIEVNTTEFFDEMQQLMSALSQRITKLETYTDLCESAQKENSAIPVPETEKS